MKRLFCCVCVFIAAVTMFSLVTVAGAAGTQNISGTSYKVVAKQSMNVKIDSVYAPYLVSTAEVRFTPGDAVTAKAAELCRNAKSDEQKVAAIYNFIAGRWYQVDLTYAVGKKTKIPAAKLTDCVSPLTYTQQSDALAVTAA